MFCNKIIKNILYFNKQVLTNDRFHLRTLTCIRQQQLMTNQKLVCGAWTSAARVKPTLDCRGDNSSKSDSSKANTTDCRRCFSNQYLAPKKKKMANKLNNQERAEKLQPLLTAGWSMVNNRDAIYKEFIFKDFKQAFSFMSGVALLAEQIDHHPEWFNVYNKVQITMSTHSVAGLSDRDIHMANFIEEQAKRFS